MTQITRHNVAEMILRYFNHEVSLQELVDWSENLLMDGEALPDDAEAVYAALARIGVADSSNFTLTYDDWDEILTSLGYTMNVQLKKVA